MRHQTMHRVNGIRRAHDLAFSFLSLIAEKDFAGLINFQSIAKQENAIKELFETTSYGIIIKCVCFYFSAFGGFAFDL